MDVRTKLIIEHAPDKIDLKSSIVTIGSCFAQNIYSALSKDKIKVYHNPFGTLYNSSLEILELYTTNIIPISMGKMLMPFKISMNSIITHLKANSLMEIC